MLRKGVPENGRRAGIARAFWQVTVPAHVAVLNGRVLGKHGVKTP